MFLGIAAAVIIVLLIAVTGLSVAAPTVPLRRRKFAEAIAFAEGYGREGAIPTFANNPGDLTKGDFGDTGKYTGPENIILFESVVEGWDALYRKLANIVAGDSAVYSVNDSIRQMAEKYAPGAQAVYWSRNVAEYLGANEDDRIGNWLD